jgi:hypothetical protein
VYRSDERWTRAGDDHKLFSNIGVTVKTAFSAIGESEKREALERVLASSAFHRTDQLRSLLRYVCEREISGHGHTLDECTVAVEALGRPSDYSPFEDGTVRNRVHNLRRRLEQYYETENPGDPIHIVVPKGSYCPVFEYRAETAPLAGPPAVTPEPAVSPAFLDRTIPLRQVLAICALVVLGAGALSIGLRAALHSEQGRLDPVIAEAWGPLVEKNAHPLLCVATAAQLTLIQHPMEPPFEPVATSPDLLSWYQTLPSLPPARKIFLGPSLTSPFWGDVAGALAIDRVLSGAGVSAELLPEAAIQMPALYKRNLLMFGRPGFSKAVDLFLADKPFRVRIPDEEQITDIWNVDPKPGEPRIFDARQATSAEHRETAFGLITVMPSLGDANLRTVVLSGTLSPGIQAASEFFSSPKHLQALLRVFRKEGYGGFPPAWQVVVRSTVYNTSALDVRYVTHRAITARPQGR